MNKELDMRSETDGLTITEKPIFSDEYSECRLCLRSCGVNRNERTGYCGVGSRMKVARVALHYWEEPCISGGLLEGGAPGSGAVFFSGCNMRCVFCQNAEISRRQVGAEIGIQELADRMLLLQSQGALNINLVTASHYVPSVVRVVELAKRNGLSVPIVYNCGGYESVDTLKRLEGVVDIYLPDYKYADSKLALRFSGCEDYPEVAFRALEEMERQLRNAASVEMERQLRNAASDKVEEQLQNAASDKVEEQLRNASVVDADRQLQDASLCRYDARGIMQRGMIIRHLILPGHKRNSRDAVKRLFERFGNQVCYSLMSQYTPMPGAVECAPELGRRITKREYDEVVDYALELGMQNAYIQEREVASESFIPHFSNEL